jgi:hypothetical protein
MQTGATSKMNKKRIEKPMKQELNDAKEDKWN